jgi:hypothetical protein
VAIGEEVQVQRSVRIGKRRFVNQPHRFGYYTKRIRTSISRKAQERCATQCPKARRRWFGHNPGCQRLQAWAAITEEVQIRRSVHG